jgi:hypothetical protein
MTVAAQDLSPPGGPRWVAASLDVKEGRDPLGLQTTTQDRLMPRLLPGILELSRQARYFSFHAYLLDRYRELRLPADGNLLHRKVAEASAVGADSRRKECRGYRCVRCRGWHLTSQPRRSPFPPARQGSEG